MSNGSAEEEADGGMVGGSGGEAIVTVMYLEAGVKKAGGGWDGAEEAGAGGLGSSGAVGSVEVEEELTCRV